jgi:diaminohydroxyphosphoribosylaminopyrimidine deaminase / 5-amino-6-(5-phosphoribosylamino)uracil reductase
MAQSQTDAEMMRVALALARSMLGKTAPNPTVGCVIARAGQIVGRGVTQSGGRPHAEAMAVMDAGILSRGATAYVTLEPCAHLSARGPACCDVLIEAGLSRIVVAMLDPDPRTAGKGLERLSSAGVVTEVGQSASQAEHILSGYLKRMATGLPEFLEASDGAGFDGKFTPQPNETPHETLQRLARDGALRVWLPRGSAASSDPAVRALLDAPRFPL